MISKLLPADINERKSRVRIFVTKVATLFVFAGGALLIAALVLEEKHEEAIDLFSLLLPVAAGVISYWFAARGRSTSRPTENATKLKEREADEAEANS